MNDRLFHVRQDLQDWALSWEIHFIWVKGHHLGILMKGILLHVQFTLNEPEYVTDLCWDWEPFTELIYYCGVALVFDSTLNESNSVLSHWCYSGFTLG